MSDLRERIAAAAQELYLAEGIEGLSMRRLAERVGVSAPAIYRHYESKDELLAEIVGMGLKSLERYLEPALAAPTPIERLRGLVVGYLDFALEQPQYFDFAFMTPSRVAGLDDELTKPQLATFRLAVEQVGACMADGSLEEADPLETALLVWAEAHGLVTLYRIGRFGPDEPQFRALYGRTVDRLLSGLAPRRPARTAREP
jgi:AcrR family transcriptional regulator